MSLPPLTVALLDHHSHEKSLLPETLRARLVVRERDAAPPPPADWRLLQRTGETLRRWDFHTGGRKCVLLDFARAESVELNLFDRRFRCDVVLVVMNATGLSDSARILLQVFHWLDIEEVIVLFDVSGWAEEYALLDRVEYEARLHLSRCGYRGDETPVLRGELQTAFVSDGEDEAACRFLDELLDALEHLRVPPFVERDDFLLGVEAILPSTTERRVQVYGRVDRGAIEEDDKVEIVGMRPQARKVRVREIRQGSEKRQRLESGEGGWLLLQGAARDDVDPGQVVARSGTVRAWTEFEAVLRLDFPPLLVTSHPAHIPVRGHVEAHGGKTYCTFAFLELLDVHGQNCYARVRISVEDAERPIPLEAGWHFWTFFTLWTHSGRGLVTRLL
jgi:hypothetical protein